MLAVSVSLSLCVGLSGLIWHSVRGPDVSCPITWLFPKAHVHTNPHVLSVRGERRQREQRGTESAHQMLDWAQLRHKLLGRGSGGREGGKGIFYSQNHEGAKGRGLLHKRSSRSACTAWPTVQRQTEFRANPPSSLSFSLSVSFSLSALTNTTAWVFWKTKNMRCLSSALWLTFW